MSLGIGNSVTRLDLENKGMVTFMVKYNVVLDTNIYFKSPSRADLHFMALERLCKAGIVQLHLPYIVEREFQTQQIADNQPKLEKAISALDSVLRNNLVVGLKTRIQGLRAEMESVSKVMAKDTVFLFLLPVACCLLRFARALSAAALSSAAF